MAVAHDGEAVLSGDLGVADPQSLGSKTTAGTNRLGIVHLRFDTAEFGSNPVDVTWGGVSMTQIGSGANIADAGGIRSFRLVNPPTASSAISVDLSGATVTGYVVTSFNGVDQITPIDTAGVQSATGTGTTPTATVSSATGNMVASFATAANVFSATGSGQTQEAEITDGGSYVARASYEAGAASVVMDYTIGSANWATLAFEINADTGGGGGDPVLSAATPSAQRNRRHTGRRF